MEIPWLRKLKAKQLPSESQVLTGSMQLMDESANGLAGK